MNAGWAATAFVLGALGILVIAAGRAGAGVPLIVLAVLAAGVAVAGGGEPPDDDRF